MLVGVVWDFPNISRSFRGTLPIEACTGKVGEMFVGMGGHAPEKLALSSSPGGQVLTASQSRDMKAHRDEVTFSALQFISRTRIKQNTLFSVLCSFQHNTASRGMTYFLSHLKYS